MEYYGLLWGIYYGLLQVTMDYYGLLLSMGYYGLLWVAVGSYGLLWVPIGYYGFLWVTMGYYCTVGYLTFQKDPKGLKPGVGSVRRLTRQTVCTWCLAVVVVRACISPSLARAKTSKPKSFMSGLAATHLSQHPEFVQE